MGFLVTSLKKADALRACDKQPLHRQNWSWHDSSSCNKHSCKSCMKMKSNKETADIFS